MRQLSKRSPNNINHIKKKAEGTEVPTCSFLFFRGFTAFFPWFYRFFDRQTADSLCLSDRCIKKLIR